MPDSATTPALIAYDSGPSGEIVVSEAAVAALVRTRGWVLLAAIVLSIVGGGAFAGGAAAGVGAVVERNNNDFPFLLVLSTGGLLLGCAGLIAASYLLRFCFAIGAAYRLRRPQDLERALIIQHRMWRIVVLALIVAILIPTSFAVALILSDPTFP